MALTTTAYAGLAETWAADAAIVYGPLARHLADRVPWPVAGALALDAGAGSGVAGAALVARGARLVATDREFDMASYGRRSGAATVTADVTALPFRGGTFDLVVAAFVVNHLAEPRAGLTELRRVTRDRGALLLSTFSTDRPSAKGAVDAVAEAHGFVVPAWYDELQQHARAVGDAASVEKALAATGWSHQVVTETPVDVGLTDPGDVVRYRLALPHLHAFAAALPEPARTALVADAVAAVRRTGERFTPVVVEAVATAS